MNVSRSRLSEGWPEQGEFRKSIRFDFSLFVSTMILTLMLISGYVVTQRFVRSTSQHIAKGLLVQARAAAGTASMHILAAGSTDGLMLNSICGQLASDNPDIYWVGIVGPEGAFIAHTDIKQVISRTELQLHSDDQFSSLLRDGELFAFADDTTFVFVPIVEGEMKLGGLSIASSTRQISEARQSSITAVASITLLFIIIGIPITLVLLQFKLKPISVITRSLKQINLDEMSIEIPLKSKNEFGYLAETLRVMGAKLSLAQQESIEKERMEHELEIAREIQTSILPKNYPESGNFRFAGDYQSAKEVGGDYYDFLNFGDDQLAFIVADVSGKSLPAMLVMLLVRDIIKRLTLTIREPAELLTAVNRELFLNLRDGMFVTMFLGVLNTDTGTLEYASAGHSSFFHATAAPGKLQLLKAKGFPLGLVETELFEERIETRVLRLAEGDSVTVYTDGVNEAKNLDGAQFGIDRFTRLIEERCGSGPEELVEHVTTSHRKFIGKAPLYDDTTLLVLRWKGLDNPGDERERRERLHVDRA